MERPADGTPRRRRDCDGRPHRRRRPGRERAAPDHPRCRRGDVPAGPGRRSRQPEALHETRRGDHDRLATRVLRISAALGRVADPRRDAHRLLGGGRHQRVQPARQHGRALRRHRVHRRRRASGRLCRHGQARPAQPPTSALLMGARRVPRLQLPSRVDLHGRQRQPVHRLDLAPLALENAPDSRAASGLLSIVAAPSWCC